MLVVTEDLVLRSCIDSLWIWVIVEGTPTCSWQKRHHSNPACFAGYGSSVVLGSHRISRVLCSVVIRISWGLSQVKGQIHIVDSVDVYSHRLAWYAYQAGIK